MAKLEEQLFAAIERIGILEVENARLREENRQLREENARLRAEVERLANENTRLGQQLAAARKDSSISSKLPSS
ncbi:MAG: cell division protein ZapB, partial [Thermogutta sp.]